MKLSQIVHSHIYKILKRNNWNVTQTARDLCIAVVTLRLHIRKLDRAGYDLTEHKNRIRKMGYPCL